MYKKITIKQARKGYIEPVPVIPYECDHTYHPFSYYINGGNDPTGEHTDMTGHPTCDTAEDIAGGARVDAFADPRTNFFDVVEQAGSMRADAAADSIAAGEKVDK